MDKLGLEEGEVIEHSMMTKTMKSSKESRGK